MAKSFTGAQGLAAELHRLARKKLLAQVKKRAAELDIIYGQDAEAIKAALADMLGIAGVPARRVNAVVTSIMDGSRAARLAVLESAVLDGAKAAFGTDQDMFDALFAKEENTPPPKAGAASASPRTPIPKLRLVDGSGDWSPETD